MYFHFTGCNSNADCILSMFPNIAGIWTAEVFIVASGLEVSTMDDVKEL